MNKVILIGRSASRPELRYTQGGTAVCTPSMAVNKSYTDKAGNRVKNTLWVNCVFYGKRAEWAADALDKGTQFYVEGELSVREYETKAGVKRTSVEVIVQHFEAFGPREREEARVEIDLPPVATATMSDDDILF